MADEPDTLVLTDLRRSDTKFDHMADDIRNLRVPMTGVDEGLVGVHHLMDRFEVRLERIERRLDLVDEPH